MTEASSEPTPPSPVSRPFGGKTVAAFGILLVLVAVPHLSDRLARFRIGHLPWEKELEEAERRPAATPPAAVPTVGETQLSASENKGSVNNALPSTKSDELDPEVLAKNLGSVAVDQPQALDAFYTSLAKTLKQDEKHVTRILHYGDSVITSDYVSGTMRRKMQARFGDAGHGFILLANGWDWYFHNDVSHGASSGWTANRISGPLAKDGIYGLGGVVFHGTLGASAFFGTAQSGDYGRKASRFDVYYMEQPNGGDVEVKVAGKEPETFSTRGETAVSKVHAVEVPDGEAKLTVRAMGKGDVRLFGVALERDAAGVTYDALGALGARAKMWEPMNQDHWEEQFALRKPALIVLQFGTNESEDGFVNQADYEKTVGAFVDKVKAAAGRDASVLVASPLDRAEKSAAGTMRSSKALVRLVGFQERVAKDKGVAFWNTWKAMGGEGAMGRWLNMKPQLCSGDLTHPTPAGAEVIGDLFYKALVSGYEAWASKHPGSPPLPPEAKK